MFSKTPSVNGEGKKREAMGWLNSIPWPVASFSGDKVLSFGQTYPTLHFASIDSIAMIEHVLPIKQLTNPEKIIT